MATPTPPDNPQFTIDELTPRAYQWVAGFDFEGVVMQVEIPVVEPPSGPVDPGIVAFSMNYLGDGDDVDTWYQMQGTPTDADAIATTTDHHVQLTASELLAFNGASFDRLRSGGNEADALATLALGVLRTASSSLLFNGATYDRQRGDGNDADALSALALGISQNNSFGYLYNGSTFDRQRGNTTETLLPNIPRTASTDSPSFINYNATGAHFIINVSALTATPSIVVTIQALDVISTVYYDVLVSNAITATGTTVLKVHPGINPIVNGSANDMLPRIFRVSVAHADADSITYSIGANLTL